MKKILLSLLIMALIYAIFAEIIVEQNFENSVQDTWDYVADPVVTDPYYWGIWSSAQGGPNPTDGTYYWRAHMQDTRIASLTFENVELEPGQWHKIIMTYWTQNLEPGVDQFKICVEYDEGNNWDNWRNITIYEGVEQWMPFIVNIPPEASTVRMKLLAKFNGLNSSKYAYWDNISIRTYSIPLPPLFSNSPSPVVSQRTDGSKIVDIYYDMGNLSRDVVSVQMMVSLDGGHRYDYIPDPANLSGDIGEFVTPGMGRHIIWNAGAEGIDFDNNNYTIQLIADNDLMPVPDDFVYVEAGTIYPDDEAHSNGLTSRSLYVGKFEVTQAEFEEVMGYNPSLHQGDPNRPVDNVTWFNAIEYCNRRSLKEGLFPTYRYSIQLGFFDYIHYGFDPDNWPEGWDSDDANQGNIKYTFLFGEFGYHLLSEEEWEFIARGGIDSEGYQFSGSDNLSDVAWHYGNSGAQSHPVGEKDPNELGVFDMSGNVWEWCCEFRPLKPLKGGSHLYSEEECDPGHELYMNPTYSSGDVGFRVARGVKNTEIYDDDK
ncbi:MAG: formylglycine-generating enzyme family protein [Candidatus Cloacimonetes bacterium]|nr:formylglycine-generating enzyme family protein [Candidatus Cloacimonadota bacterium]